MSGGFNSLDDFRAKYGPSDEEIEARELMRKLGLTRLQESVPGLLMKSYGGVLPVQAEGTLYSMPFYFRQRSGPATLNLGEVDGSPPYGGRDSLYSTSYHGSLDPGRTEDFILIFREMMGTLERSPWMWTFEGAEVKVLDGQLHRTGQLIEYCAYAHTVDEALAQIYAPEPPVADRVWLAMHLPSESPVPPGYSAEDYWHLVDLCETPLVPDARVFPPIEPPFPVLPLGEK